jgi:hypothetical protein
MDVNCLQELATDWTRLYVHFIGTLVLDNAVSVAHSLSIQLNSAVSIVSTIKQLIPTKNW